MSTVPRLRNFNLDDGEARHPGRSHLHPPPQPELALLSGTNEQHPPSIAPSNKHTWEWIQENLKDRDKNNWEKKNSTNVIK